jgi:hypothetical protein
MPEYRQLWLFSHSLHTTIGITHIPHRRAGLLQPFVHGIVWFTCVQLLYPYQPTLMTPVLTHARIRRPNTYGPRYEIYTLLPVCCLLLTLRLYLRLIALVFFTGQYRLIFTCKNLLIVLRQSIFCNCLAFILTEY